MKPVPGLALIASGACVSTFALAAVDLPPSVRLPDYDWRRTISGDGPTGADVEDVARDCQALEPRWGTALAGARYFEVRSVLVLSTEQVAVVALRCGAARRGFDERVGVVFRDAHGAQLQMVPLGNSLEPGAGTDSFVHVDAVEVVRGAPSLQICIDVTSGHFNPGGHAGPTSREGRARLFVDRTGRQLGVLVAQRKAAVHVDGASGKPGGSYRERLIKLGPLSFPTTRGTCTMRAAVGSQRSIPITWEWSAHTGAWSLVAPEECQGP